MASLDTLVARLGVEFTDRRLLQEALVHGSYLNERLEQTRDIRRSNERLEFLGDAVVNFLATTLVHERFPEADEGQLTLLRASLIRTETLAAFARRLDLGSHVLMGRGEHRSGARMRDTLLADVFEAVVAAIYLDSGLDAARGLLMPLFEEQLEAVMREGLPQDHKSALQTRIQAERNLTPRYRTVAVAGPEHMREITVEIVAGEEVLGRGTGRSKQAAAQEAARAAIERLDQAADAV